MNKDLKKKIYHTFYSPTITKIFFREKEISKIKEFLNSDLNFFHICGKPGTGKTMIVNLLVKKLKGEYFNAFTDIEKIKKIPFSKGKLFVIDEFDKFFNSKIIIRIKQSIVENNQKLITISNYLEDTNSLYFNAYTTEQIEEIIFKKLNCFKPKLLSDLEVKIIARRCNSGDLRKVYEEVIKKIEGQEYLEVKEESNLHKKLIDEVLNTTVFDKFKMYEEYLKKCELLRIIAYEREDFYLIVEMLD